MSHQELIDWNGRTHTHKATKTSADVMVFNSISVLARRGVLRTAPCAVRRVNALTRVR